jgi:hypothetical protein
MARRTRQWRSCCSRRGPVRMEMKSVDSSMYALREEIYMPKHASERSRGLRGCLRNRADVELSRGQSRAGHRGIL